MHIYSTVKSKELFQATMNYLSGGIASSLHKSPREEYPIFIDHASGSRLYDVDGNEYVDYMGAFGPMILGYANPAINAAVAEQLTKGSHFAAPTESLRTLCEKLIKAIPCAERISFQTTGTEVCMQAVQLARAYTGKEKIIKFEGHYHGWSEELRVSVSADSEAMLGARNNPWKILHGNGQRHAASDNVIVLPWNDLELVSKIVKRQGHEIAAIITEPFICNAELTPPRPGYLEGLRTLTRDNDILLIFDEIITGFRLSLSGAQGYYGVTPDLATFAKAMAGGYPIACVAGRKDIMESGVTALGTFNANPVAVAASIETLKQLEKPGVYENLARITGMIVNGVNDLAKKHRITAFCKGEVSIWLIQFGSGGPLSDLRDSFRLVDKNRYQKFYVETLKRGVRLHPLRGRSYLSAAHNEDDVKYTLEVFDEVFTLL